MRTLTASPTSKGASHELWDSSQNISNTSTAVKALAIVFKGIDETRQLAATEALRHFRAAGGMIKRNNPALAGFHLTAGNMIIEWLMDRYCVTRWYNLINGATGEEADNQAMG
jgi:hypothetical protein